MRSGLTEANCSLSKCSFALGVNLRISKTKQDYPDKLILSAKGGQGLLSSFGFRWAWPEVVLQAVTFLSKRTHAAWKPFRGMTATIALCERYACASLWHMRLHLTAFRVGMQPRSSMISAATMPTALSLTSNTCLQADCCYGNVDSRRLFALIMQTFVYVFRLIQCYNLLLLLVHDRAGECCSRTPVFRVSESYV